MEFQKVRKHFIHKTSFKDPTDLDKALFLCPSLRIVLEEG